MNSYRLNAFLLGLGLLTGCASIPEMRDGKRVLTTGRMSCSAPVAFGPHCVSLFGPNYFFDLNGSTGIGRLAVSSDGQKVLVYGEASPLEMMAAAHPARGQYMANQFRALPGAARYQLIQLAELSGIKVVEDEPVLDSLSGQTIGYLLHFDKVILETIEKNLPRRVSNKER